MSKADSNPMPSDKNKSPSNSDDRTLQGNIPRDTGGPLPEANIDPEATLRRHLDASTGSRSDQPPLDRPDATLPYTPPSGKAASRSVEDLLAANDGKQKYVIDREIARGGMGAILRAVDRDIRREVAMKVILDRDREQVRRRFVEEVQVTGQLEHPNIVPIHELGLDQQGRLYFTMKLVKGRSLKEVLDELRNDPSRPGPQATLGHLLTSFLSVCNAVAFAHSKGVVHRDLKPANVMLGDFGEVLVMDWGLAKVGKARSSAQDSGSEREGNVTPGLHVESSTVLTMDGTVIGTPACMPPEQARGELDQIDERSDIYSLGAILYQILTLEFPVSGSSTQEMLIHVIEGNILPPTQRAPKRNIPRELSAIAMKALARNKEDRYQTVQELRRDIELFVEGRAVSAKEDTAWETFRKLVKRNKGASIATAVALVIVAILVAVAYATNLKERLEAERQRDRAAKALADFKTEQAARQREERARKQLQQQREEAWMPVCDFDFSKTTTLDPRFKEYARQEDVPSVPPTKEPVSNRAFIKDGLLQFTPTNDGTMLRWEEEVPEETKVEVTARNSSPDGPNLDIAISGDSFDGYRLRVLGYDLLEFETLTGGKWEMLFKCPVNVDRAAREYSFAVWRSGSMFFATLDGERIVEYYEARALKGKPHRSFAVGRYYATGKTEISRIRVFKRQNPMVVDILEPGRVLLREGNRKSAEEWFSRVAQERPEPDIRREAGFLLATLIPDEEIQRKERALEQIGNDEGNPFRGMVWRQLHGVRLKRGDVAGAVEALASWANLSSRGFSTDGIAEELLPQLKASSHSERQKVWGLIGRVPFSKLCLNSLELESLVPFKGIPLRILVFTDNQVADLSPLKGMPLKRLVCDRNKITDLSPLKGMKLEGLSFSGNFVSDLSVLEGMPLDGLMCVDNQITNLSPLKGMPLDNLACDENQVIDLSPIRGMPLVYFSCAANRIVDISPLKGMPLKQLSCGGNQITDLSPLKGMRLEQLYCGDNPVTDLAPLQGIPLTTLDVRGIPLGGENGRIVASLPLTYFDFDLKSSEGLAIARNMKTLETVNDFAAAHFFSVADDVHSALQGHSVDLKKHSVKKGASRFLAVPHYLSLTKAEAFCRQHGGVVACPSTKQKAEDIKAYLTDVGSKYDLLMGLKVDTKTGGLVWASGESISYEAWEAGRKKKEDLGQATMNVSGTWRRSMNGTPLPFVVEWKDPL